MISLRLTNIGTKCLPTLKGIKIYKKGKIVKVAFIFLPQITESSLD